MSHWYCSLIDRGDYPSLMTAFVSNRRSFVGSAAFLTGAAAISSHLIAQPAPSYLTTFLKIYDGAWPSHDPQALAVLHAEDVLVVNRFGSMPEDRAELAHAMQFLHGPGGQFHTVAFYVSEHYANKRLGLFSTFLARFLSHIPYLVQR